MKHKYIVMIMAVVLLFPATLNAQVRPIVTQVTTYFQYNGQNVDHVVQSQGMQQTYNLLLPLDMYLDQISVVSVQFQVFNGAKWYYPDDDFVAVNYIVDSGILYGFDVILNVTASHEDKIHELTLCYQKINLQIECNAFRVYTDDGSLYSLGYGVDTWVDAETTPFKTLYFVDEYFLTAESVPIYCTTYEIAPAMCAALIPITIPGEGFSIPTSGVNFDYSGTSIATGTAFITGTDTGGGWNTFLDDAATTIRSTADRSFYDGLQWVIGSIVPNIGIDTTPLVILADYLYFFGVYISTVQAVVPLTLFKLMLDLALWGVNLIWVMSLWGFMRRSW